MHAVGRVELGGEESRRTGYRDGVQRQTREAPEQDCAIGIEVVVQVPRFEHRAGRTDVDRPSGADHDRLLVAEVGQLPGPQLPGVLAVLEDHVLELAEREAVARPSVRAGQPLLDHHQPRSGAQRALGLLVSDDAVEAGQRLLGIREPVAVVGVGHIVGRGAAEAGSRARISRARTASASDPHSQAESEPSRTGSPSAA